MLWQRLFWPILRSRRQQPDVYLGLVGLRRDDPVFHNRRIRADHAPHSYALSDDMAAHEKMADISVRSRARYRRARNSFLRKWHVPIIKSGGHIEISH